jgi:hypothetical protein
MHAHRLMRVEPITDVVHSSQLTHLLTPVRRTKQKRIFDNKRSLTVRALVQVAAHAGAVLVVVAQGVTTKTFVDLSRTDRLGGVSRAVAAAQSSVTLPFVERSAASIVRSLCVKRGLALQHLAPARLLALDAVPAGVSVVAVAPADLDAAMARLAALVASADLVVFVGTADDADVALHAPQQQQQQQQQQQEARARSVLQTDNTTTTTLASTAATTTAVTGTRLPTPVPTMASNNSAPNPPYHGDLAPLGMWDAMLIVALILFISLCGLCQLGSLQTPVEFVQPPKKQKAM